MPSQPTTSRTRRPTPAARKRKRRTRRQSATRSLTLLVTAGVLVAGGAWAYQRSPLTVDPGCSVTTAADTVDLASDEAMRVASAVAVAHDRGLSTARTAAAVAAARAGTGDGSTAADVARWLGPAEAPVPADDTAIATAMLGGRGPALTCRAQRADDLKVQAEGRSGLTPRADAVRAAFTALIGRQSLGGYAPGGVSNGHGARSAHYEGRAVDVFFRPINAENRRDGWVLAQWLTAHAQRLDVATVIFDDRIWTTARSREGWRRYVNSDGPVSNDILQHRDHVHVDVQRGS
ncbi:MAG: hypothetical protein ACTHOD_10465 [Motilibacteraceae bacterium]